MTELALFREGSRALERVRLSPAVFVYAGRGWPRSSIR